MASIGPHGNATRRGILGGAAALSALPMARAAAQAGDAGSLPPNLPAWARTPGAGVIEEAYGTRSAHESRVLRRYVPWLTADRISSVSFTPLAEMHGIITPSGLHFERHHGRVPEVDPADYRLMLHGLVDRPLIFTLNDLKRLPSVSRAVTAYVLFLNELIGEEDQIDAAALSGVAMPNRDGFMLEARPDTPDDRGMSGCRVGRPVSITVDSRRFVQPGSASGFSEPQ